MFQAKNQPYVFLIWMTFGGLLTLFNLKAESQYLHSACCKHAMHIYLP